MSPIEIGLLENFPNAPLPLSLNRHFGLRRATLVELIELAVVARVLARLRLCAGHWFENCASSGGGAPTLEDDDALRQGRPPPPPW